MALYENKAQETTEQSNDDYYFEGMTGLGTEGMTGDAISQQYLSMIQPGSQFAVDNAPGQWRNSATGEVYGPTVTVIPLAFKEVWTERNKDVPYNTVGRYEPNSIEVHIEYPKPGQRGFPKMTNPQTGNKVEALFIYAIYLAHDIDAGVLYFSPTAGSMKACKQWNMGMRSARQPNGKPATIGTYTWDLTLEVVQNPAQPNNPNSKITKFVSAKRSGIVNVNQYKEQVVPQLIKANNIALLAAPETSGDVEEGSQA